MIVEENNSMIDFLYLNACFIDFLENSAQVYNKIVKSKDKLEFKKISDNFKVENENNEKLYFNQKCIMLKNSEEEKNKKILKIEAFYKLDLKNKYNEEILLKQVNQIVSLNYKILFKNKTLFSLIGDKLFNYINKSNNLFYLIIKMIKENEKNSYNELSKLYQSKEVESNKIINNYKAQESNLLNEIKCLKKTLEEHSNKFIEIEKNHNTKLNDVISKYNDSLKKLDESIKRNKDAEEKFNEINIKYEDSQKKLDESIKRNKDTEEKLSEINIKYEDNQKKLDESIKRNKDAEEKLSEINIKYEDMSKELNEIKEENKNLKYEIKENQLSAEESIKILKDLNNDIIAKLSKDEKIYETYQEKIFNYNILNSIIEMKDIEIQKKNSEIERLKIVIDSIRVDEKIKEKLNK